MFKRVDVLAIAILIALIYVGAIISLQLGLGLSAWAEGQNLNILGDSIGGLTAPLALIFLIAAVIIQRQELALTKDELAKTAKAMEAQADTAKEQAETAKLQSQALTEQIQLQREIARANYKVSLFEQRFALWNDVRTNIRSLPALPVADLDKLMTDLSKTEFVFGTSLFEIIRPHLADIVSLLSDLRAIEDEYGHDFYHHMLKRIENDNFQGLTFEADRLEKVVSLIKQQHGEANNIRERMIADDIIRKMRLTMAIETEIAIAMDTEIKDASK